MRKINAKSIKEIAEDRLNTTIEVDRAIKIVNHSLYELGSLGLAYQEATFEAEKNIWYDFPPDDIEMLYVIDMEKDNYYYRYRYENGRVNFAESGEYKVACRTMPQEVDNLVEDTIDLNPMYKAALVDYFIAHIKLAQDDTSEDGHKREEMFQAKAERAYKSQIRERKPATVRVERHV